MQYACKNNNSTMAAILALPDDIVNEVCENIEDVVLLFEWILDIDYSNRNILTNGKYTVDEKSITILSDGEVVGIEISISDINSFQTLDFPQGWSWRKNNCARLI